MFRTTVHATESSNVDAVIAALRSKCERSSLSPSLTSLLLPQVREALTQFVSRGQQLVSAGSQMHATREVSGKGYRVKVVFRAGDARTALQKLLDSLRGR